MTRKWRAFSRSIPIGVALAFIACSVAFSAPIKSASNPVQSTKNIRNPVKDQGKKGAPGKGQAILKPEKVEDALVVSVIDGETIEVIVGGKREFVKLIGIEAPETRYSDRAMKQSKTVGTSADGVMLMGESARRFLKDLIKNGSTIGLEFGQGERDGSGRLPAYIWKDGKVLVNMVMAASGYAFALPSSDDSKFDAHFKRSYDEAVSGKRGLWASFGDGCFT